MGEAGLPHQRGGVPPPHPLLVFGKEGFGGWPGTKNVRVGYR